MNITIQMNTPVITLTLTIREAERLSSALYIASNHYYGKAQSPMAAWTHGMATSISVKIEDLTQTHSEEEEKQQTFPDEIHSALAK
jgi:hypothetical protein